MITPTNIFTLDEEDIAPGAILFGGSMFAPLPIALPLMIVGAEDEETPQGPIRIAPRLIDYGIRFSDARGLYRVFNAPCFRFYRSSTAPPPVGSAPFTTNATLPYQPTSTYADGTWYLSASYFNGVLDSGFLPLGPNGETYLTIEIVSGVAASTRPSPPYTAYLKVIAGGVVQIVAAYPRVSDAANAAKQWAIAYTTDGSTPPSNAPSITPTMMTGPLALLSYNLPAQANGTVIKVQLQTLRSGVYSLPGAVLSATASSIGPSAPLDLRAWPGQLPEDS